MTPLRAVVAGLTAALVVWAPLRGAEVSWRDRRYYAGLYRDTWNFLSRAANEETGLPHDSSRRGPATSTANAGLYLAACAVAGRTGLIPPEEAVQRIERVLSAMERVPRFAGGFPVTWFSVATMDVTENRFSTADHLSQWTAGLLVVKGLFSETGPRVDRLLTPMDWADLLDPERGLFMGGWRRNPAGFDTRPEGGHWHHTELASEARFGYVWGLATRAVPWDSWGLLDRTKEDRYNYSFHSPGWSAGLAMAFTTGVFLDERASSIGKSAADLAWSQIHHAARIGAPVWGWSACEDPGGALFLGRGELYDSVVTPYAVALAAVYYPAQCAATLRAFEKRGARRPRRDNGSNVRGGFRESYNWRTGRVSDHALTAHQALIFLSLANLLHDGVVWRAVSADPHIQSLLGDIPEYRDADPSLFLLYAERDRGRL